MSNIRTLKSSSPASGATDRPDFLVGQDSAGHWLALETHGLAGGIFRSRDAALHYAMLETSHRPEAVHLTADRVELRI
ncbi:hypothetical protein [Labrys wisconsinensis]|uniref:RAG2 PHD domain containing protein n=1 Tax=Labrys wisconsinensis TaxID=425677 RepID=A0ABU0J9K1_9HYPH|nr:hypothetical protein [Labrys wisconsinensis]MDQ0470950.1 hypothetical protein [Labrys wisconsinensis]